MTDLILSLTFVFLLALIYRKRWQVYHADPFTAAYRKAVNVMYVWRSWNAPDLVIPKQTLDYGFYLATYTVTMWGECHEVVECLNGCQGLIGCSEMGVRRCK